MLMSCLVLVFPLCTPCSDNADCDGWVMSAVWRMVAVQKTSSTVSWLWAEEPQAALTCDTKMSAFIRDMKAVDIDTMSWEGLAADRTEWRSALKQHGLETGEEKLMAAAADKRARRKEGSSSIRPETTHVDVMSAIKTAIHALVFSAISDAAATQREINKN